MDHLRFDAGETSLIIACAVGAPPHVIFWGARLLPGADIAVVARMIALQGGPGSADALVAASLTLEPGLGIAGPSGFAAHRTGQDWGSRFDVTGVVRGADSAAITCEDDRTRMRLDYRIDVGPETGVITIGATLTNLGDSVVDLVDMATACLPIPGAMTQIIGFSGRWTDEFCRERLARFHGDYLRENRRGRTSHDSFPAVILCGDDTNESNGEAYGLHLAWSGNHRIRVSSLNDGRVFAMMGTLLFPGEIRLEPGESFASPPVIAAYSARGLTGLSQHFHRHVRARILRPATRAKPRPVHCNSWEAMYFDHDIDRLKALASAAAAIGVERFVLDDGWFGARRNDCAGLGDWTVSDAVYPDGLAPLIDHVTGLGMEMGLWFEPEMVNPDSDLFRAHPDWVLGIAGVDAVPFRNQLVLDISRAEVADHLFGQIDAILTDHAIAYIKWDMNRDLNHPGDAHGRPVAAVQVTALYALLDRIRAAHPGVEIESCASGGARADYGVLAHTDRVWTSDSNDAIDRQTIQRGASFFLPLEVLGAHVGPRRCHVTGRPLSMAMRAGTALMGHMGVELDLLAASARDLTALAAAIALHKAHRALLHSGDLVRLDTPEYLNVVGVVAADGGEAMFSLAWVAGHADTLPGRLRLAGLDAAADYRVKLVWPQNWRSRGMLSAFEALDLGSVGAVIAGDLLQRVGLQLPLVHPDCVILLHLSRVDAANRG